jgi:signal transduction histidine kinase
VTQEQLLTQEKLASLGALTAGIAHEIKNPLNFVNNFASLSKELCGELLDAIQAQRARIDPENAASMEEMVALLAENSAKIEEHGKRADGIVRSMLEHSGSSAGQTREADLNALVREYVRAAVEYPAAAGVAVQMDLDGSAGALSLVPEDIGRVILNLVMNALYEMNVKKRREGERFVPMLIVTTRDLGDAVEVRVRDNGRGIPKEIRDRIFSPFFTTKPPGEGAGLGLSLSYDIVVQGHGGWIGFESEEGQFTEFVVTLPRRLVG